MTADLVAFLKARLAEDEQVAQSATLGPWWHNPFKQWLGPEAFEVYDRTKGDEFVGYGGPAPFVGCVATTGPADDRQSMADARHIARHDPARVLAEVDAKRRILDHLEYELADHGSDNPWWYGDKLLPILRLLALPYADHPDYRPEWAPRMT